MKRQPISKTVEQNVSNSKRGHLAGIAIFNTSPPTWLKVSFPVCILGCLALLGGGRMPSVLAVTALVSTLALWINRPPFRRAAAIHWYAGLAIMAWLLLSTVPLPNSILGERRIDFHEQAANSIERLRQVYPHTDIVALSEANFSLSSATVDSDAKATQASSSNSVSGWNRLTLNYSGTMRFFLLFCGTWAMMWLTSALSSRQRHLFLCLVVAGGSFVAAAAMLGRHFIPFGNNIWWLFPTHYKVSAGPFININHFASFCAILIPAAMSLIIGPASGYSKANSGKSDHQNNFSQKRIRHGERNKNYHKTKDNSYLFRRILFTICLLILVSATVLSFSRGGMLTMLIGSCAAAAVWVKSHPLGATLGTLLAISILAAFLFWPSAAVQREIGTLQDLRKASPKRIEMHNEALRQWKAYPFAGGGAESFRTLNGIYKTEPSIKSPLYAENEYSQLFAEHGWAGIFLILFFTGSLIWLVAGGLYNNSRTRRRFKKLMNSANGNSELFEPHIAPSRPTTERTVVAAGVGALIGLLFHFTCDFPARVPLNAFLGASLVGLVLPLPLRPTSERSRFWAWRTAIFTLLVATTAFLWRGTRLQLDEPAFLREATIPQLAQAIHYAPAYWVPWNAMHSRTTRLAYKSAQAETSDFEADAAGFDHEIMVDFNPMELYKYGFTCLERAAELNHMDFRMWSALAEMSMRLNVTDLDSIREALHKAAILEPARRNLWGKWFQFEMDNNADKNRYDSLREIAVLASKMAPRHALRLWRRIFELAQKEEQLYKALDAAVNIVNLNPSNSQWWRNRAAVEEKLHEEEAAVNSLMRVVELEPEDWQSWMRLGELQLRLGKANAANRAFTTATNIRPALHDKVDEIWRAFQLQNRTKYN